MDRIAAVLAPGLRAEGDLSRTRDLAAALLDASPRVAAAGPGLCRVDAGGWGRRGGEEALAGALREAARREGIEGVGVGVADTPVAADAAALVAARAGGEGAGDVAGEDTRGPGVRAPEGARIVPSGREREFLAPLPLAALPLSADLRETLRALGLRRVGELAARGRGEVEARFGPDGVRAHGGPGARTTGSRGSPFRRRSRGPPWSWTARPGRRSPSSSCSGACSAGPAPTWRRGDGARGGSSSAWSWREGRRGR